MHTIYRPRCLLRLTIPLPTRRITGDRQADAGAFQYVDYDVQCRKIRWEQNDHNHADSLSVDVDWADAGVDPRWIAGGLGSLFLDNANEFGEWQQTDESLRFVGRMVKPSRTVSGDSMRASLEFIDFTSYFLGAKPVATAGIPLYSDTLQDAWARLCAEVPNAETLAASLIFRGLDAPGPIIGSAVADRFVKAGGRVVVKPGTDAWAIWQQVVGMMGLISYFDRSQCVVTTAEDLYTAVSTPRMLWGTNLIDFTESRNNDRGFRGVGITSYDPLSGRALEAIYDPESKIRSALRVPPKKHGKKPAKPPEDDHREIDYFAVPGVTSEEKLQAIARRVYFERKLQELEGHLTTAEMVVETTDGQEFDLLDLKAGDTIDVRFLGADDVEFVQQFDSVNDRVTYLVAERGYRPEVAQIIASNVQYMTDKSNLFYVKSSVVELEFTEDGGSYRHSIDFINKIDPGGGAAGA